MQNANFKRTDMAEKFTEKAQIGDLFLNYEIRGNSKPYRELLSQIDCFKNGNCTWFKNDGSNIIIGYLDDEGKPSEESTITLSHANYLKMLDRWDSSYRQKRKIYLKRDPENTYHTTQADTADDWVLGIFLSEEVGSSTKPFKEFIFEINGSKSSDRIWYENVSEDQYIIIGYLCDENESPEGSFITLTEESSTILSYQNYLKMLNQWEDLYQQKPDEIIIAIDDDFINLESR